MVMLFLFPRLWGNFPYIEEKRVKNKVPPLFIGLLVVQFPLAPLATFSRSDCAELQCAELHCPELHCAELHCVDLHCAKSHCAELHCAAQNYTAPHRTTLRRTELHFTKLLIPVVRFDFSLKARHILASKYVSSALHQWIALNYTRP